MKKKGGIVMLTDIIDFIDSCVFPVAMCILFYMQNNTTIEKFTNALNDNTNAITKLLERLDK